MRSNSFFNLFDKCFNLNIFYYFTLVIVPTIILPVIIIITLGILGINTIIIRVTIVLRAVFIKVIRFISTTILLIRRGRVTIFIINARFVNIFYSVFISLNTAVLNDRPFTIIVITIS